MYQTSMMRLARTALAIAAALTALCATAAITSAADPPSAKFHVTSRAVTLTNEDGEPVSATIVSTVVNLDFGDALLAAGIDPSSIRVTVNGEPLDFTTHGFTFNHERLSVTIEEWRLGAVTQTELNQRRFGNVSVSYVPPADAGDERLRYASGSDVGSFAVTASVLTSPTRDLADAVSFVAPAQPSTVTATIRGNASPKKSQTVTLTPATSGSLGPSAPTSQNLSDIGSICQQLGGSDCRYSE